MLIFLGKRAGRGAGLRERLGIVGFATIFGAVAAVFELIAHAVAAGQADRQREGGIVALHVACPIEKFRAAAFDETAAAGGFIAGIRQLSARWNSVGTLGLANFLMGACRDDAACFLRTVLWLNVGAGFRCADGNTFFVGKNFNAFFLTCFGRTFFCFVKNFLAIGLGVNNQRRNQK